jgi:hypothetical protein
VTAPIKDVDLETLRLKLAIPNAERIFYIAQAFQKGRVDR